MHLKILEQKDTRIKAAVEDSEGELFGEVIIDCWTISRMATVPNHREEQLIISFDCYPTDDRPVNYEIRKKTPLRGTNG
jgi:hypothetical protein